MIPLHPLLQIHTSQVIIHLNTINEKFEDDKHQIRQSHDVEIKAVKEEAESQLELLRKEINDRDNALQELTDKFIEKEKEAHEKIFAVQDEARAREKENRGQLVSVQHEARIKETNIRGKYEKEVSSLVQTVRELSQKLEVQSRNYQEKTATMQSTMTEDHKKRTDTLRKEMSHNHTREVELLKSRHENDMLRAKNDASEKEKSAVESVVSVAKLEYERKLSQQLIHHNEKYQMMKAEVTESMKADMNSLQQELDRARQQAGKLPGLRANIELRAGNEKKLQTELKRLQQSMDSMTASNQEKITKLQQGNACLHNENQKAHDTLDDYTQQLKSLDDEVRK